MVKQKKRVNHKTGINRLCICTTGFVGLLMITTPCIGQPNAQAQAYRDSLYRHIWIEGSAQQTCRFTYAQGSATIETDWENNRKELIQLDQFIHTAIQHPNLFIERIRLTGYSSIEGAYHINEELSRNRVESFYNFLRENYPELYRYPHDLAWVAEDWKGLANLVRQSGLNEKEEILEIIRKVPGFDERETLLLKLNGGSPYDIMEQRMLQQLRRVEIEVEFTTSLPPSPMERELVNNEIGVQQNVDNNSKDMDIEYVHIPIQSVVSSTPSPLERAGVRPSDRGSAQFMLKTNLLQWAGIQPNFKYTTPVANIALEYNLNHFVSIELGAMYSYWRYNSNQEFQGISGYRLEPRFHFPLWGNRFGVYLGLYGRVGDYDLRTKSRTTTPAATGKYWDTGLSGGTLINLINGLGIEIGARVGYIKTKAAIYTYEGGNYWFDAYQPYGKIKVTDLNVSLIFQFR